VVSAGAHPRRIAVLCLLLLAGVLLAGAAPPPAAADLPVLCYHDVQPQAKNIMTTTPQLFAAQMAFLKAEGYNPVGLFEVREFLAGRRRLQGKPILITFDDGYEGVYKYAYPVLQRHRFPAVVFLVASQVGAQKPTPHLTWKQIERMRSSGLVEFGSHTYALHLPLPEKLAAQEVSRYRLERDLVRSREVLIKHGLGEARALAWPYGHYDERCIEVARKAGFRVLFTTDYGRNLPGSGLLKVRRVRVSSEYDTIERLREKLLGNF